jgi:protein-S-isoprenylcysteine O-methyltransferase Ste14
MLTGMFQSAVLLVTGLVYYVVDSWLLRYHDRQRTEQGSGRSWGYTAFMIASWALLVVQPMLFPGLGLHIDHVWGLVVQSVGVLLVVGGLGLQWWARSHLRHFYVEDVHFQDGQYLIDSGPYRLVRHPVFTSFFMIAVGLALVNPAVTTFLLLIYVFVDFLRAARKEEELLTRELPEYASYMQRTGRFLPKWR